LQAEYSSSKAEVFIQSVHFKMGEALPWNTKLERKKASFPTASCSLLFSSTSSFLATAATAAGLATAAALATAATLASAAVLATVEAL
jgi:hypothetical protein